MEKLYLKTKAGIVPLDPSIVEKYDLKPGMTTPFSHASIVDQNGEAKPIEDKAVQKPEGEPKGELVNDGISQLDNGLTLSQSEMIDFSQGVDSSNR
jgi:hypothetical protein